MATSNKAPAATYEKGKLYELSVIDLKPDPNQPRKSMDPLALEELAASIKTHGVIQPILFRTAADSPYLFIVAGERRYKVSQQAGKTTRTKKDVNAYETESGLVGKAMKRLSALDTAGWEYTDMETFRADLLGLKEWIDAFLAPPSETPAATTTQKTTKTATLA